MREIKFRCWYRKREKMIYFGLCDLDSGWNAEVSDDISKEDIMQFTGLLDKNGKEIYEGDIVTAPKKDGTKRIAPVIFYHGHFMLTKTKTLKKWRSLGHKSNKDQLEVVGNIYEHGHFLK